MTLNAVAAALVAKLKKDAGTPVPTEGVPQATPDAAAAGKVLAAVNQRVTALIQAIQTGNGATPDNLGTEVKVIAQALMSLVPDPTATPAEPAGAQKADDMAKAELDPYTACSVTFRAAQDRMWGLSDLMREKKIPEAQAEMKGISDMLSNAASLMTDAGTPAPADAAAGTVKAQLTQEQLAAYTVAQLTAATTDAPEAAQKRLAHLKEIVDVAKAYFFEQGNAPQVVSMEFATAYAPFPEPKMDLTVTSEQVVEEHDIAKPPAPPGGTALPPTVSGNSGSGSQSATGGMDIGKPPAGLGGITAPTMKGFFTDVAAELARAMPEETVVWPHDLNTKLYDEKELAKSTDGIFKRDIPWGLDGKR